jgi:hypothetical protein
LLKWWLLHRRLLRRCRRPIWVAPYLIDLIRVLLALPARSLRNRRPYRLHRAERREPLIGVQVGIAADRALRSETGVRPDAFVE